MREFPYPDIIKAIGLFKENGGKRIVEIGSMRQPVEHDLDQYGRSCCQDGHSSALLARAAAEVGGEFWTVDADPEATRMCARELLRRDYGDAMVVCGGGVQFLTMFRQKIDLLYLDFVDVDIASHAEDHLRAFKAIEAKLPKKCLVMIDDTDHKSDGSPCSPGEVGGKGRLLVPYAIDGGWESVWMGRTTLLTR